MHNKVVYQTAKSLDAIGIPVLRFNFRGAGVSAGVHNRGQGEKDDVRATLDFLASQFPGVPLLLAGFSFGAWVGMRVGCEDPRVSHLIGLGIPVNSTDFSFLHHCNKPKLFVHGSNDEHGAIEKVKALIPTSPARIASWSSKASIIFLPANSTNWAGHQRLVDGRRSPSPSLNRASFVSFSVDSAFFVVSVLTLSFHAPSPREKSLLNSSAVAGATRTNRALAFTCSTRDIPTRAVVIPGEDLTNCSARSASFPNPSASATNPGRSSPLGLAAAKRWQSA